MKAYCLASSSHGNCYILEFDINGVPTRIMVECGIPIKDIFSKMSALGMEINTIKSCLITHAHGDHCHAAGNLNQFAIPIFGSIETINRLGFGNFMKPLAATKVVDGIYAMTFPVEHDIDGAVGFVIKTKSECVLFVNDHKRWTHDLRSLKPDYVFIECNYDHKVVYAQLHELQKRKKTEILTLEQLKDVNTKIAQHERNLNAHCSLHGTLYGLKKINLSNCKAIFLMHLSDRYANEYRMKNEVELKTQIATYVCGKQGGIK